MKLSEIFNQLTTGELSQLHIGDASNGLVREEDYPKLVNHVNLGLAALYRRFPIKEGRINLILQPGQTSYTLVSGYAIHSKRTRFPTKYLEDSVDDPFDDDINKIERVITDKGYELDLNIEGSDKSCFTPTVNVLRVPQVLVLPEFDKPNWAIASKLEVVYRSGHPLIAVGLGIFNPERIEVELPYAYLEALLYFIASRVHNPVGMGTEFNAGNTYAMKYESACAELENLNLKTDQAKETYRLVRNGWV